MTLHLGDCLDVLKTLPDASVDAVVTDPPYELGFMGKKWDAAGIAYNVELWREALRVLKPGGHLLAFGGTRTYHRMACAIEDAGFEIRDSLHWVYGSGFPKSLDVSKAIDKAAGAEREVVSVRNYRSAFNSSGTHQAFAGETHAAPVPVTAPATDAARQWEGWGTALKPAHEPVVVARKPLAGTVADNVQQHGTGALNIDASRVESGPISYASGGFPERVNRPPRVGREEAEGRVYARAGVGVPNRVVEGRWPPNILLSHTPECGETCDETCAVAEMDRQSGITKSTGGAGAASRGGMGKRVLGVYALDRNGQNAGGLGDSGGASRFFPVFRYQAKASRSERNAGLDGFPEALPLAPNGSPNAVGASRGSLSKPRANVHPTVKPVELMRWLVRLVTPPGGVVLDPFTGSGTTGVAATLEGFDFIGIEREPEYHAIATARIEHARGQQPAQAELFSA